MWTRVLSNTLRIIDKSLLDTVSRTVQVLKSDTAGLGEVEGHPGPELSETYAGAVGSPKV